MYGTEAYFDYVVAPFVRRHHDLTFRISEYLALQPVVHTMHAFFVYGVWQYYREDLPTIECTSHLGVYNEPLNYLVTGDCIHQRSIGPALYGELCCDMSFSFFFLYRLDLSNLLTLQVYGSVSCVKKTAPGLALLIFRQGHTTTTSLWLGGRRPS